MVLLYVCEKLIYCTGSNLLYSDLFTVYVFYVLTASQSSYSKIKEVIYSLRLLQWKILDGRFLVFFFWN